MAFEEAMKIAILFSCVSTIIFLHADYKTLKKFKDAFSIKILFLLTAITFFGGLNDLIFGGFVSSFATSLFSLYVWSMYEIFIRKRVE